MSEKKNAFSRREVLKTGGAVTVALAAAGALSISKAEAAEKPPRWAMVIDLRKCIACYSCQVSCKMENSVPIEGFNSWVIVLDKGKYPDAKRVFLPKLCNHCEGSEEVGGIKVPPCVKICPEYPGERAEYVTPDGKVIKYRTGATYKHPGGAILFDNSKCIGCGKCIDACPYGVRYFNPHIKAGKDTSKNGIGKCTFCDHRITKGLEPACNRNCAGRARYFGDLSDPDSEVSRLLKENPTKVLKPDEKTNPNVYYIALDEDIAKMKDTTNPEVTVL